MTSGNSANGVAIVTGAAGGMGSATAKALLAAGWTELVLCDLDASKVDEVASPLRKGGATIDIVSGNVAAPSFPQDVVDSLKGRSISAMIHTAGIATQMGDVRTILEVNLAATVRLVEAIRAYMTSGSAAILIASNSAHFPLAEEAKEAFGNPLPAGGIEDLLKFAANTTEAYKLSKFGVMALVKREAKAFGKRGARIVSISPGATNTPMVISESAQSSNIDALVATQAIPRMAKPEEIADLAVFLASDKAAFITATDILIDGGMVNALVA